MYTTKIDKDYKIKIPQEIIEKTSKKYNELKLNTDNDKLILE